MVASPSSKKVNMPAAARSGLVLLLLGALIVGLGSYFGRGGLSFYGLIIAVVGFLIYVITSIKRSRQNGKDYRSPK